MDLVTPDIGLLFWMMVSFGTVVFLLKKFAWKPILDGVKQREASIEDALNEARKARAEIAQMKAGNEDLMAQAREEREILLKEARDVRDAEIATARDKARTETEAMLTRVREDIRNEKLRAIGELKTEVAELSVQVAEAILREKLANDVAQQSLVDKVMKEAELRKS